MTKYEGYTLTQLIRSMDMDDPDGILYEISDSFNIKKETMMSSEIADYDYSYDYNGKLTLYGIIMNTFNEAISNINSKDLSIFETSKKYETRVDNVQIKNIVMSHNLDVKTGEVDAPLITTD